MMTNIMNIIDFFFINKRTFQGRPKIVNSFKRSSCLMSSLFKNFDVKKNLLLKAFKGKQL